MQPSHTQESLVATSAIQPELHEESKGALPKPLKRLEAADVVFWSQKAAYLNALSGGCCVINNQYKVYEWDSLHYRKGRILYKLKQDATCCNRVCIRPCVRGYNLNAILPNTDRVAHGMKPIAFPCFGCCRPEMRVYLQVVGDQKYEAMLRNPFNGCTASIDINEPGTEKTLLTIRTYLCQCALCCPNPCACGKNGTM